MYEQPDWTGFLLVCLVVGLAVRGVMEAVSIVSCRVREWRFRRWHDRQVPL